MQSEAGGNTAMQMKYKIVFLGDQSVGKTSIILRFTQDSFDVKYQVSSVPKLIDIFLSGYHWNRLFDQDSLCWRQDGPTSALGHSGIGEVPQSHPLLHQWLISRRCVLRYHLLAIFPEREVMDWTSTPDQRRRHQHNNRRKQNWLGGEASSRDRGWSSARWWARSNFHRDKRKSWHQR